MRQWVADGGAVKTEPVNCRPTERRWPTWQTTRKWPLVGPAAGDDRRDDRRRATGAYGAAREHLQHPGAHRVRDLGLADRQASTDVPRSCAAKACARAGVPGDEHARAGAERAPREQRVHHRSDRRANQVREALVGRRGNALLEQAHAEERAREPGALRLVHALVDPGVVEARRPLPRQRAGQHGLRRHHVEQLAAQAGHARRDAAVAIDVNGLPVRAEAEDDAARRAATRAGEGPAPSSLHRESRRSIRRRRARSAAGRSERRARARRADRSPTGNVCRSTRAASSSTPAGAGTCSIAAQAERRGEHARGDDHRGTAGHGQRLALAAHAAHEVVERRLEPLRRAVARRVAGADAGRASATT